MHGLLLSREAFCDLFHLSVPSQYTFKILLCDEGWWLWWCGEGDVVKEWYFLLARPRVSSGWYDHVVGPYKTTIFRLLLQHLLVITDVTTGIFSPPISCSFAPDDFPYCCSKLAATLPMCRGLGSQNYHHCNTVSLFNIIGRGWA